MVGDYDYGVVLSEVVEGGVGHVQVVMAATAYGREVGVVVRDDGALFAQKLDDGKRRRLAEVVDVSLVGEAEDHDFGAFDGFSSGIVEGGGDLGHDEVGHAGAIGAGQLDEASAEVEFTGLPGEVEGVDRDAMAAEAGSGIEGLKAEGFGFGGVDDFVDVDAHAHAERLSLAVD